MLEAREHREVVAAIPIDGDLTLGKSKLPGQPRDGIALGRSGVGYLEQADAERRIDGPVGMSRHKVEDTLCERWVVTDATVHLHDLVAENACVRLVEDALPLPHPHATHRDTRKQAHPAPPALLPLLLGDAQIGMVKRYALEGDLGKALQKLPHEVRIEGHMVHDFAVTP